MKYPRLYKVFGVAIVLFVSAVAATMMGSFRFNPDPSADFEFIARAQQKSAPGIKVSASALGAQESQRSLGENLAKHDIQPVWLSIENETDDQLVYTPIATDPEYYSPYEVSYGFHGVFSFAANHARDNFFLQRQMPNILPPHSRTTGFVYGVLDAGMKYAHIVIAGNNRLETFDFALPVPGAAFVGTGVRADIVYPDQKIENLDLDRLKARLASSPCCTTDAGATRNGDPLNLVVIEGDRDPIIPFISRGWHLTRKLDVQSMIETVRAFILSDEYLTSPVSPLYVFGRQEDVAIQKARSTINERIHARFWLTPYTFESRRVWIGQVSRDIGVRLTHQTWNLTTHKISPDVDFDRGYVVQDLSMSGFLARYGFVDGVGAAPASAPRSHRRSLLHRRTASRPVLVESN
jgi:hypothetical protein